MAQDSDTTNQIKPADVDINELEVSLLIFCKNPNTLSQCSNFLSRRGWPTTLTDNVSKAIEVVTQNKPDFFLLSVNHPSPSAAKLPDLITQTFNIPCIGFAELQDSLSQAKLNSLKLRYKVQGTPSGPNVQRLIRKILAEKYNIQSEDQSKGRGSEGGQKPMSV